MSKDEERAQALYSSFCSTCRAMDVDPKDFSLFYRCLKGQSNSTDAYPSIVRGEFYALKSTYDAER